MIGKQTAERSRAALRTNLLWRRVAAALMIIALLAAPIFALPTLVSPTAAPSRGFAKPGEVIGPITADGTTTAYQIREVKDDNKAAIQISGTWDGAAVTAQMRLCVDLTASVECPFVTMPTVVWPATDDASGLIGNIQVYQETEIRLSVASAGASTSLYFVLKQ